LKISKFFLTIYLLPWWERERERGKIEND